MYCNNPHENGFTVLRTNSYSSVIYFVKGTHNTHSLFEIEKVNRIIYSIWGVEEFIWAKRDELTREWRKLHIEQLNDLYCSPNIVLVIKSRIMK